MDPLNPSPKFTFIFTLVVLFVVALVVYLFLTKFPLTHKTELFQTQTHIEYGPPQVERDK